MRTGRWPNAERRIRIDPAANTWRYEVPPIEGDELIVYEGIAIVYELDGVSTRYLMQADSVEGPFEFALGEAYQYQVTSVQHCAADQALQTTGLTSPQDQEPRGIIAIECPEDGSRKIDARTRRSRSCFTEACSP